MSQGLLASIVVLSIRNLTLIKSKEAKPSPPPYYAPHWLPKLPFSVTIETGERGVSLCFCTYMSSNWLELLAGASFIGVVLRDYQINGGPNKQRGLGKNSKFNSRGVKICNRTNCTSDELFVCLCILIMSIVKYSAMYRVYCKVIMISQFSDLISSTYLLVLTTQSNRPIYTYYIHKRKGLVFEK